MNQEILDYNKRILNYLSVFLNYYDLEITKEDVINVASAGVSTDVAYLLLLESFFELTDNDRKFIDLYFPNVFKKQNISDYINNPYYQNIKFTNQKYNHWELKVDKYQPYQAFVYDDFKYALDGRVFPQVGYFEEEFTYPAVYENNRLWMSVTPNEINTMKTPIARAKGRVATFGLGLGYFAYMVSLKEDVKEVVIVEKDKDVIELFKKIILPQFPQKHKITIINCDAFKFLDEEMKKYNIDYLFADIWHDVADGLSLYKQIKSYQSKYPETEFQYWIESTIKYYL